MPLQEPYHSPSVHRAALRQDPSACPTAGCKTYGQPIPRHLSAGAVDGTITSANLKEMKAFHRLKHQPDPDMHLSRSSAFSGESTMHASFLSTNVQPRRAKFDFSATIPRGTLSGVGVSVPRLDFTNQWCSTRAAELDHSTRPRMRLVERTYTAIAEGRRLQPWVSSTMGSRASSDQLAASAAQNVRSRQQLLQTRGEWKPLMTLA